MEYTVSIIEDLFPGFYGTPYDPSEIERYDENGRLEEELSEERYADITNNFCEYIVSLINEHTPFKVIKWRLDSPSSYNYRNDTIWVTIETTPEQILYEVINHESSQDILFEMIHWEDWQSDRYHDALLEQLIAYPLFAFEEDFFTQLF